MFSNVFLCAVVSSFLLLFVSCEGRSSHLLRSRRSVVLTKAEKQAVVDVHNDYRRNVGASNMQKLKWNDELATLAAQWVQSCAMKRGIPAQSEGYWSAFADLGQVMNQTDEQPNIAVLIDSIVKEQRKMSPNSRCIGSAICFMYDEILGAVSTDVGCATGYCQPMNPKSKGVQPNKWFTVCYYGPGRGAVLQDPYKKGTACSKCPGAKWCDEGLCSDDCKKSYEKCECKAECMNCGKVDPKTCTCKCPKWFAGDDCSQTCEDKLGCCKTVLEGPPSVKDRVCSQEHYQNGCALSCGICEVSHEKNTEKCPVDRIPPPVKPTLSQ